MKTDKIIHKNYTKSSNFIGNEMVGIYRFG